MTPIPGIRYFAPTENAVLTGLDGKINIPYGDIPVPLLEKDYLCLDEAGPSYDAIGRGIYQLLRANPDAALAERYAAILKEGYPHYISELASQILMLEHKDVEVSYLDRKINYLKIFALIEPDNAQLYLEIGMAYMDKGLRLSALQLSTISLYRAENFFRRALAIDSNNIRGYEKLGEVSYLLGKYDEAAANWNGILNLLDQEAREMLEKRLQKIVKKDLPRIAVVDYLEAIAVAFSLYGSGEYEEAAAILLDIIDDVRFLEEYPLAEIFYYLGLCYGKMSMPRYAEEYLKKALVLNPAYNEAKAALEELEG